MYGLTETGPISFMSKVDDTFEQQVGTVGYLMDHFEAMVVDENGKRVPWNTPGELWVRGHGVMKGYWNAEEKTKEAITPDRWFKTGLVTDLFSKIYWEYDHEGIKLIVATLCLPKLLLYVWNPILPYFLLLLLIYSCQNLIYSKERIWNFRDQFAISEDGYGRVVGRIKDMIIRGGENIYPADVEEFLSIHPDIVEVQVGMNEEFTLLLIFIYKPNT